MKIRGEFFDPNVNLISDNNSQGLNNYVKVVNEDGEEMKHIYSGKKETTELVSLI